MPPENSSSSAISNPCATRKLSQTTWVRCASGSGWSTPKHPSAPQHVLDYLGRYTHRVAISNRRLLALENGEVSLAWKDYRDAGQDKVMTVSAEDFIRRFLQHALPPGFQRIRYYGFLANCHRARKLDLCRQLLATPCSALLPSLSDCRVFLQALTSTEFRRCPQCGVGILACIPLLPPQRMDSS